jgi:hypothetical protein
LEHFEKRSLQVLQASFHFNIDCAYGAAAKKQCHLAHLFRMHNNAKAHCIHCPIKNVTGQESECNSMASYRGGFFIHLLRC